MQQAAVCTLTIVYCDVVICMRVHFYVISRSVLTTPEINIQMSFCCTKLYEKLFSTCYQVIATQCAMASTDCNPLCHGFH